MLEKGTLGVWLGILLLACTFLMGQEDWAPCQDLDGDGYGAPASPTCAHPEEDCDDDDPNANPGMREGPGGDPVCTDATDNACDGLIDDADGGCVVQSLNDIPAGCFQMGDAFDEGPDEERPVHTACLPAFQMDVHETTNEEYARCVDAGQCQPPFTIGSWTRAQYYGNPSYDDYPVIWVNWAEASDYCTWADKRLPTEAEWEYAARGGLEGRRYPWGDEITGADANFYNSGDPEDNDTNAVMSYPPNGYGLYDMTGNVLEWVNDWFDADYYDISPQDGPQGPEEGYLRVLRGGAWDALPDLIRVSARGRLYPTLRSSFHGFRCAR